MEGREDEQRLLSSVLADARRSRSGTLGFRGPPGSGKTTLCEHAVRAADGMTVLVVRGTESERDLSLAALLALLRPLDDHVDDLPDGPRVVARALLDGVGSQVGADPFALGVTCLALLALAAEKEPVLVVVDDAQWIDDVSGHAMAFAFRRLARDAVAVVLACRDGGELDDRACPLPGPWPWIELGGLGADEAVRLLGGRGVAPAVAARLREACAGNPLALLELAAGLSPEQRIGSAPIPDPVPLGPRGTASLGGRLTGLTPACLEALTVLAVAGDAELPDHARALADAGVDPAVLEEAERAGVVRLDGGPRFVHPLLRSAVATTAGPEALRRAHASWAALGGITLGRRAHHLASSTVGVSEEVAAALEQAADLAADRGGVAAGVDALVKAAAVSPDPTDRARRRLRAAESAFLAGRRDLARELVGAVLAEEITSLDETPAGLRDQALALDASLRVWTTEVGEAHTAVRPVIDRLAGTAPELAALVGVQLVVAMWSAGQTEAGTALGARLRGFAVADPAIRHLVELAYAIFSLGICDPGPSRDLVARGDPAAWRTELLERFPSYYTGLHHWWRYTDRIEAGLVEIGAHIEFARERMATTLLPHPLMLRADIRFETGEVARARSDLTEAIGLCEATGQGGLLAYAHAMRGRTAALEGDEPVARSEAEAALEVARSSGLRPILLYAHHTLGLLELGLGRPDEAVRHLDLVRATAHELGSQHPKIIPWHADLVEALLGAGRCEEAAVVSAELVADAERCDSAWSRAVALGTEARVAPDETADALLVTAIEAQDGLPLEQARTRLFLGEHRRRHGRVRDAREPLAAAAATFAGLGVVPWARRAEAELRAAGGSGPTTTTAPDLAGLTDRELQICLAVADGATNKEVGAALFLSRKTVEYHLGNVFRKLGVTSRAQLTRLVARSV